MVALRPMFGVHAESDGDMIAVLATSTTGTVLHTAVTGTNHIDEVYIYACNIHTANVEMTFEIGGAAAKNQMVVSIPFDDGYHLVLPGLRVNNGTVVAAFALTTAVINCIVTVNRYIDPETAS